jgi:hypothetical protein
MTLHVMLSSMFTAPYLCESGSNDSVNQSMGIVFNNKNIHLSTSVEKEKVGDFPLNMCSVLQSNNRKNISKCVMGYYTFTSIRALKQMGT